MLLWVGGNCGFLSFKSASEHANQASDRQRAGVVPTNLRKTMVKWLWSEKPRRLAAFEMANVVLLDRESTRLNSSHTVISFVVFFFKKKKNIGLELRLTNSVCP